MEYRTTLLFTLLLLGSLTPAAAQSSGEAVLERAMAVHESAMEGVENYTLTHEMMGVSSTLYFEREEADGPPVFRTYLVTDGELQALDEDDRAPGASFSYETYRRFVDEARYAGTETVAGEEVHAFVVDDLGAMASSDLGSAEDADLDQGTFYFAADDYRARRIVMEGSAEMDGRRTPIVMTATLSDYRTVDGMTHPFRTAIAVEGMDTQVSEEDRAEARRQLEQLKQQMEEMPSEQRAMMERMMGGQIDNLEQMLAGEGFEMELVVTDLRVNQGPPGSSR